jgi:hypothetical protein
LGHLKPSFGKDMGSKVSLFVSSIPFLGAKDASFLDYFRTLNNFSLKRIRAIRLGCLLLSVKIFMK